MKLFNQKNALHSLRKNELDTYDSYGEVIDNAIQGGADNIHLLFTPHKDKNKQRVSELVFTDNGIGMTPETLSGCLTFGESTRLGDTSGMGKFGVGLSAASIHECRDIKVFSKHKDSEWHSISLKISEFSEDQPDITDPVKEKPPAEYLKKIVANNKLSTPSNDGESGTIIIWKDHDQNNKPFAMVLRETFKYIGRVYRKYIWKNVEIYMDNKKVYAIDPLYYHTELTEFPEDPRSDLADPITFQWPMDNGNGNDDVIIQLSLLPEEFRKHQGEGGSEFSKARHIPDNEGISILRNGREIFYGRIPGLPVKAGNWKERSTNPIHRWWGCEISFNAVLDDSFNVKNIKRRASPNAELKELIDSKIKGTVATFITQVQKVWHDAYLSKKKDEDDRNTSTSRHSDSEKIADKTVVKKKKNLMAEKKDAISHLNAICKKLEAEDDTYTSDEEAVLRQKYQDEYYSIKDTSLPYDIFMDIEHKPDGGAFILYNNAHPLHLEISNVYEKLLNNEDETIQKNATKLMKLMDLFLISYVAAEQSFEGDATVETGTLLRELKKEWGLASKSLLKNINKNVDEKRK